MLYIWELGDCFVKDIVAKYTKPAPPYTTVASIVKNLERKQYVHATRVGNTYQYTPLIRESEYKRTFMSGFVRNYFENSYKEMVSFFAKEQKISTNDLKDIINMIEKGKEWKDFRFMISDLCYAEGCHWSQKSEIGNLK